MDGVSFNVSQFIAEVRSRPLLYDSTSELYLDREAKAQAWEEILTIFCPDHENKEEDEKLELVVQLQKKWKNIRDTFVREQRKVDMKSSGSNKRRYRHYKELLFLSGMMKPKHPFGRSSNAEEEDDKRKVTDPAPPSSTSKKTMFHSDKKRRREAENNVRSIKQISPPRNCTPSPPSPLPPPPSSTRTPADDESDRLFLLSLLSDLKRVPDQFKLEVKCELMNVIKRYSAFTNPQDALQNCVFTTEETPNFIFKTSPQHSSDESDM